MSLMLIYFRVANGSDDRRYSFIPVWRLGLGGVGSKYGIDTVSVLDETMINAIDGKIIDVAREWKGK